VNISDNIDERYNVKEILDYQNETKEDTLIEKKLSEYNYEGKQSLKRSGSIKKRDSLYKLTDFSETLFRPEFQIKEKFKDKSEKLWQIMESYLPRDPQSIQKSIINHIEYTLARTRFSLDKQIIYQGTSLSVRDRLLEAWNDAQSVIKIENPKRLYYLSIEFLLGRLLQNALINLDIEEKYKEALYELGYKIEDIYERENDPALGNGGLGRLAACYLDSLTTLNFPAWGYGIRYDYGIFKQAIENCQQIELPDYWLTKGNPWEIMRLDVNYKVKFYGYCKDDFKHGRKVRIWEGGQEVEAVGFDTVIPGWGTLNCNTLRLWKSYPSREFNFESFNKGNYAAALEERDHASYITSVLYPNDSTAEGKELRLKQQYFFCCATINDIVRRFINSKLPWSEFPNKNAVQLNDTHPTIAAIELLRQLIDIYYLDYTEAYEIVRKTFGYTNHTVLPEALEKWSVELISKLLPRHMELIFLINHFFLEEIKKKYPNNLDKISRLSIIQETRPKMVRMSNLCIICSHSVNGVAEIHSQLIRTTLFKNFYELFPRKFTNITNGVTPRRWIHCAFRELSNLLSEYYESDDWLGELSLLERLPEKLLNEGKIDEFLTKFESAKKEAKKRLVHWVKENCHIEIDYENFMFDVMVKRIHEYKRQFMNALYCVYRYLSLKDMSFSDREKQIKRVTFFGGKAAPGYTVAKNIIRFINTISKVINNDSETNKYFKVIFLPDYKVSLAQVIIPAADLSQHISTVGTEASGTSNMKFCMTGSLIIGTRDGANIEIADEIGQENIFFFGKNISEVENIRNSQKSGSKPEIDGKLKRVFDNIINGKIGDNGYIKDYLYYLMNGNDIYCLCYDFNEYLNVQERVDREYGDIRTWRIKCMQTLCRMGFFSTDRSIQNYAENIWELTPIEIPKPVSEISKRVISTSNLKKIEKN